MKKLIVAAAGIAALVPAGLATARTDSTAHAAATTKISVSGKEFSLHLSGMSLDLLRGGLVTITAMLIFAPLVKAIVAVWGSESAASHAVVVVIAATVGGAALWKIFHSVRRVLWFALAGVLIWGVLLVTR